MELKKEDILAKIEGYQNAADGHLAQYNACIGAAEALKKLIAEDTALKEAEKQAGSEAGGDE